MAFSCFYAFENSSSVNVFQNIYILRSITFQFSLLKVSFRLIDCGVLKELKETNSSSSKHQTLTQFYIQIIVLFEQTNNGTTVSPIFWCNMKNTLFIDSIVCCRMHAARFEQPGAKYIATNWRGIRRT